MFRPTDFFFFFWFRFKMRRQTWNYGRLERVVFLSDDECKKGNKAWRWGIERDEIQTRNEIKRLT